jgi:hypothetical protein
MKQLRVLYLRTFGGSKAEHFIIASISKALMNRGRVIVMGDSADLPMLSKFWTAHFGSHLSLEQCVDYIKGDNSTWRVQVHRQIVDADIIVAFFTSKDSSFPPVSNPEPTNISQTDYIDFLNQVYATPLSGHMSGMGLLHEICYVQRLGAIPKTVTICRLAELREIVDLIRLAGFASGGISHSGDLRKVIAPRLTVLDQQLQWLGASYGPIPFKDPSPTSDIVDGLDEHLAISFEDVLSGRTNSIYEDQWGRLEHVYLPGTPDSELPLGRSEVARSLPPDYRQKILRHWKVEDLIAIPVGEIIDISLEEARNLLSKAAVERGCPYCFAPLEELCFHAYGLVWPSNEAIRAKCQMCGRRSSLWGDMLMDV